MSTTSAEPDATRVGDRATLSVHEVRELPDRAAWDDLVAAMPLPTPFLRTWWLDAVATDRRRFVLVMDGPRLVGGLALQRRRIGGVPVYTVQGGGRLCPDHLDLLAEPGRVGDVVSGLQQWFGRRGSRVVDLDGLFEATRLREVWPTVTPQITGTAPHEPLNGSLADYNAARSKTFVKRVRSRRRRSATAGVGYRRVEVTEVPAALDALYELHAARPDRLALLRHFPAIKAAFVAGAEAGEVWVHVAERDGEICGVLLSTTTGNRLSTYQLARRMEEDFHDVGTILYTTLVEDSCTAGWADFDFLRGDEGYKSSFAAHERSLLRLRAAHGWGGRRVLSGLVAVEELRRWLAALRRGFRERFAR